MANKIYSWSKRVQDYAERLEAMACFGSMPEDDFVAELELQPLVPTFKAADSLPLKAEGLKPFRYGEIVKWN